MILPAPFLIKPIRIAAFLLARFLKAETPDEPWVFNLCREALASRVDNREGALLA
jgi:hypothetical protein